MPDGELCNCCIAADTTVYIAAELYSNFNEGLLTVGQVQGLPICLNTLCPGQISPVAGHLLEVAQELNEADHAILVGVRILHLSSQRLGCLLVLHGHIKQLATTCHRANAGDVQALYSCSQPACGMLSTV